MPKFVFTWHLPAKEVTVSGNFNKGKALKLERHVFSDNTFFSIEHRISSSIEKVYYRFNVDGKRFLDDNAPQEAWQNAGLMNIIRPSRSSKTVNVTLGQGYPYNKLDFDTWETRLLVLKWSNSKDDLIECSLEHKSLFNPGQYLALSYCVRKQCSLSFGREQNSYSTY